ncbi:tetratricopeptide repeat protein [Candidatus Aminicenantes bacterium AC-335-A11]|jgi:tetratricopeptide (TPR) repeat protein|nr:tetratricopeptide repeat protein [SCandidatus Aminicenantes bacterium Aminicenantia_JdfR_composite]MCP2597133.1 tetratricopeptide repeat protein [Candidatus Aminicenantes bacterium AC-335-G13]MCP2618612.1 tetratricopeptide repeat protein [Candidatus Aminicenantes bacterium AC-335-A11]MCP2621100.1 tetratricopeptide repeat protein [Candidatus Aminicenantes bacterium AC-334-E05]
MKKVFIFGIIFVLIVGLAFSQAYRGKGRLRGVVKDKDGNGIPDVRVRLYHVKSAGGFEVKTNEKGVWVASWLRGGLWYIDFEKEGYLPKKISVTISELRRNPDVEIILKKLKAPVIPKELLDQLDKGNKLFADGKYDEAIEEYKKLLEKRPEFYQININIGNAYMKKEDYETAISYFQKVLEKDPKNAEALISSGNCYVELKDYKKAIEIFKQIDKEDINDPVVLYNIGTIFYNNGEIDKAIEYYEQSIIVKKDFVDSYYQLGLAYLSKGNNEKALENFNKYLEIDSTSDKAEQVKKFIEYLKKTKSP